MRKVKIKELFDIRKGKKAEEVESSDLRYIQIEDLRDNDNIKVCSSSDSNVLCNQEDILIAWDGANAGTVGFGIEGVIGSTIARLRPKTDDFVSDYVGLLLQSKFDFFQRTATGATIPHVSRKALENLEIPLPSPSNQEKIVAKLDRAQRLIDIDKEMLAKYDELIQSVFLEMFGDPVTNPKGWEIGKLSDVLSFLTSGSRGWAKYYAPSGSLFLRIQNVGYDQLRLEDLTYVEAPNSAESKRTRVKRGDIIMSITADLGRTAVIPDNFPEAFINQHLAILRLNESIAPRFLSSYIASKGGQVLFNSLNKGGVKAGLNFSDIKSYKIFKPNIEIQKEFIGKIEVLEKHKCDTALELKKSKELFSSLVQGAFGS